MWRLCVGGAKRLCVCVCVCPFLTIIAVLAPWWVFACGVMSGVCVCLRVLCVRCVCARAWVCMHTCTCVLCVCCVRLCVRACAVCVVV